MSFFRLPSNSRDLINTRLKFIKVRNYEEAKTRLNRLNMLQDGKKRKKVSIHMHDTFKLTVKKKKLKKKRQQQKNGVNGIRTHIHENRWLLVYIYSKNERSTYCAIESLGNYT